MNRIPACVLAAALALAAGCARAQDRTAGHPLAVEPAHLDLGSVPFGERRDGAWTLRNTGARPLEIVRVGPLGCQCADAVLALPDGRELGVRDGLPISAVLAPGAVAQLRFRLDTSRYREPISRKIGSVPVLFADHPPLVLEWSVDVWTPFAVEPWDLDLGEIGVRQRASGRVLVQAHDDDDFGLEVDADVEGWTLRSERLSAPGEKALYQILVTAPPELPEGGFQREFRFLTDLPGAPPVRFSVRGVAGPDLALSPRRVFLDPARGRAEAFVTLTQRAAGAALAAPEIVGLPAGMTMTPVETADAAQRSFRLRWEAPPPSQTLRGVLSVRTGDGERPLIELPWTVVQAAGETP